MLENERESAGVIWILKCKLENDGMSGLQISQLRRCDKLFSCLQGTLRSAKLRAIGVGAIKNEVDSNVTKRLLEKGPAK